MRFNYKQYGGISRPIIPILLSHKDVQVGYHVLIDSGADICIFDTGIADALNIDWRKGNPKEIFGVGGKASISYFYPVTMKVNGDMYHIDAYWMPDVSGRMMRYGLAGQKGFFDKFIVKFDFLKEEIELNDRK